MAKNWGLQFEYDIDGNLAGVVVGPIKSDQPADQDEEGQYIHAALTNMEYPSQHVTKTKVSDCGIAFHTRRQYSMG